MKKMILLTIITLSIAFYACNPVKKEVRQIPLEDFFRNPEKTSYDISPNGEYFSFRGPYQDRMNIFIQEIGVDSATQITFETDRDIAGYFWANDDHRSTGGNT